ncbi:hypothetical protein GCM10027073_47780 [Streptomyces chlorus]
MDRCAVDEVGVVGGRGRHPRREVGGGRHFGDDGCQSPPRLPYDLAGHLAVRLVSDQQVAGWTGTSSVLVRRNGQQESRPLGDQAAMVNNLQL